MARKPRVITKCVADTYAAPNERIIEFSSTCGGGLISFWCGDDGKLVINVYRCDPTVLVQTETRAELDSPMASMSVSTYTYDTLLVRLAEQVAACIDGPDRGEADKAAIDALSNTWTGSLTVREWLVAAGLRLGVDTSRCEVANELAGEALRAAKAKLAALCECPETGR